MDIDWSGNWRLTAASLSCAALKVDGHDGEFALQKVNEAGRAYNVLPVKHKMTSAWDECVLMARNRDNSLRLPWPLPTHPTKEQALNAAKFVKQQIQQMGGKADISRLEGDVTIDGGAAEVVLFMVADGFANGDPLLVAYLSDDLSNPDGSAVGSRH